MNDSVFLSNTFCFDRLEVEVIPFTWCNLACDFCETRYHRVKPTLDYFNKAYNTIIDKIEQINVRLVVVEMWGGELFADKIFTDELFKQYCDFFTILQQYCDDRNIESELVIKTNLVHHHVDQIIELVKAVPKLAVGTSFDIVGRFQKDDQIELWYNNIRQLARHSIYPDITIVAHKQNIDAVINNVDSKSLTIFKQLYATHEYNIDFEYYRDVNKRPEYYVSDREVGEFVKFLVTNYPAISEAQHLIKTKHYMCKNANAEGLPQHFIKIWPTHIDCDTINDKEKFKRLVHNKHCDTCKFKNMCSPRYALEFDDSEYCINKTVFEMIYNDSKN